MNDAAARAPKIVAIMGSYHDEGMIAKLTAAVLQAASEAGAEVKTIKLHEHPIEFCTNCRQCMQTPGPERGECFHHDGMEAILNELESARGIVLAAPVNMWNINALTRRFMERCAVYGYWPWGQHAPKLRHAQASRPAVLIASSGAPAFAGQWLSGAHSALKFLARILGCKPIGTVWQGKINQQQAAVAPKTLDKARQLGHYLAAQCADHAKAELTNKQ
ncbi:MAG: flavodoxin family protein [Wenzhouxiangellaceae bacterium]